ncbi:60S ribosomal protein L35a-1 [Coemansia sp. RSA 522]|nr:60S ribosomal protein L35a-1 [Coemansia sp. RSA 522]
MTMKLCAMNHLLIFNILNHGKRVAYLFRAPTAKKGSNIRCMWGRITRPHGNSGVVRAKFRHNLPPSAMGSTVRVMMYPSNI